MSNKFIGHKIKGKSKKKWNSIVPFGDDICDLFLPMKSPYNSPPLSIPQSSFRGSELNYFLKNNPSYGAVINLCKVEYYDSFAVQEAGVEYHHLPSTSHDEIIPQRELRDDFIKLVNDIRARQPSKKIIVHCTHGCNRTCYMIVAYLAEEMNFDVLEALKLFTEKRPPGPYNLEGIQTLLHESYGRALSDKHFDFMEAVIKNTKGTVFRD